MTEDPRHLDGRVEEHYEREEREEERLTRGNGRLEFLRTLEILNRYLPPPPSVIYDVGGGTGVYALPLTDQGYEVHLLEPVERHVLLARRHRAGPTRRWRTSSGGMLASCRGRTIPATRCCCWAPCIT